jgi:hypothetical protein
MPDTVAILWAMAAAGVVTGLKKGAASSWPLAVGLGFLAGAARLGFHPRSLLATDQERLLLVVVPLAVAVEIWFALVPLRSARAAIVRGSVALAAGPLLLLGSVYLTGGAGGWSGWERLIYLVALGMLILIPWLSLTRLQHREPGPAIGMALAVTSLAAGITTMLSGYASAGQLALPLAATLVTAALASRNATSPGMPGAVGVGWVCLAGILVIGRFFGSLTTLHGLLLGAAPLLCWLAEYRPLSAWNIWPRRLLLVALVLLPLGTVVWQAQQRFVAHSGAPRPGAGPAPSMQDYLNFGR